ncbi:MAG TPA: TraB/GumN family protein [Caulobacteraceae bacterium]|jgi:hypothetical protein|nr:TraB/GumN family protein [Caulobacteraceae bacterium]
MRRLTVALAVAFLSVSSTAFAQPAVWTVRGAHATAVIFGSIHLLPPGLDWRPPGLAAILAKADELWFELPIDALTGEEAARLARSRGLLPKGDSLFNHLSAADRARLEAAGERLGLPARFVSPMRPWLAEVTLSLAQDSRAGAVAGQGVEQQISAEAPAGVRRRAFETTSEQINFLAEASMADQVASLDQTIAEIADDPDLYQRVVKTWLAGDLEGLQRDALTPLAKASPRIYRRLITDRNRRWAAVLARRLKGQGVIVVVVGTGHLLGPDGLPALLKARGLAVEEPSTTLPASASH